MFKHPIYHIVKQRIEEPRKFIQILMGPRQVGKSTVIKQVLEDISVPYKFFAADFVPASDSQWIANCWEAARMQQAIDGSSVLLVIDEIQKIDNWSEIVKKLWDEDSFHGRDIKVVLLGSSRILLKRGLTESLAGRFEEIRMSQWGYSEMRECFGYDLNQYLFFGGYPGSATLMHDQTRFESYIESSIVDASINKDILFDTRISKPALMRQTFEMAAAYSGRLLSLTKLLGQLQDAGNTTTLAHYMHLLKEAGLVGSLEKYAVDMARSRSSVPKFQVFDNSLKDIYLPYTFEEIRLDPAAWGTVFESGIGEYIICQSFLHRFEVFYWRERNMEVDFILRKKGVIVALEIKRNDEKTSKGLEVFCKKFKPHRALIVGDGGMHPEDFLSLPLSNLFK